MRVFKILFAASIVVGLVGCADTGEGDVGVVSEQICCGSTCCLIESVCYDVGDENPANSNQECDPSSSQIAWTDKGGNGDGGTDGGMDGGDMDGGDMDGGGDDGGMDDGGNGNGGGGSGCAIGTESSASGWLLAALAGLALVRRRRR